MRKPPTDVQQQLLYRYRHGRDGGYIIVTHEMGKNFQQLCKAVARPAWPNQGNIRECWQMPHFFCRRRRAIMSAGPQKKKAEGGRGRWRNNKRETSATRLVAKDKRRQGLQAKRLVSSSSVGRADKVLGSNRGTLLYLVYRVFHFVGRCTYEK